MVVASHRAEDSNATLTMDGVIDNTSYETVRERESANDTHGVLRGCQFVSSGCERSSEHIYGVEFVRIVRNSVA